MSARAHAGGRPGAHILSYVLLPPPWESRGFWVCFLPYYLPKWVDGFTFALPLAGPSRGSKPVPFVKGLDVGGKRGTTRGMRDLQFWMEFFIASRIERYDEAIKVCRAFGIALDVSPAMISEFKRRDA